MAGILFGVMALLSVICAAAEGNLSALGGALFSGASDAVTLSLSLCGSMCLFCGLLRMLGEMGALGVLKRILMPLIRLLFPETKKDKDVAGAIAMNMTANFFGMGNAATPLGINAMKKLSAYMKNGIATNSMCMLAIVNSSSLQLIPSTLIAIRSSMGSENPGEIMVPIWIASMVTFACAVLAAKIMEGRK